MHEIGQIALLQIQRSALVIEDTRPSYYDPSPLLVVKSLLLEPEGVIGVLADGSRGMDVHHMYHLDSRNSKGVNGISLGFTSHYEAMRNKFGEHLTTGIAGENIIVETEAIQTLADLDQGVAIQMQKTGEFVYLTNVKVATPCVEFSHFAANAGQEMPAKQLKETLQFLNAGMRGFYATTIGHNKETEIRVGDKVFVNNIESKQAGR